MGMLMKTCNSYLLGSHVITDGLHWFADFFENTFSYQVIEKFANLVRVLQQSCFPIMVKNKTQLIV